MAAANGENISGETKDKELVIIDKPSQKNAKKSRAFTDQETSLLISEWYKYPQLYDKQTHEYHDRDKRVLAKEKIALSLNEALGYDDEDEKKITGTFSNLLMNFLLFMKFQSCFHMNTMLQFFCRCNFQLLMFRKKSKIYAHTLRENMVKRMKLNQSLALGKSHLLNRLGRGTNNCRG